MKPEKLTNVVLSSIAAGLVVGALITLAAWGLTRLTHPSKEHVFTWTVYGGELKTPSGAYWVDIDDADREVRNIVHLRPVGKPGYVSITGHDYDNDGNWDSVFYCGYHLDGKSGCNSVDRDGKNWKWHPCAADAEVLKPFTPEEIQFAISELDQAVGEIRSDEHAIQKWRWDEVRQALVKVYDAKAASQPAKS